MNHGRTRAAGPEGCRRGSAHGKARAARAAATRRTDTRSDTRHAETHAYTCCGMERLCCSSSDGSAAHMQECSTADTDG
eukprot:4242121-Prymnesium_polylepis.1